MAPLTAPAGLPRRHIEPHPVQPRTQAVLLPGIRAAGGGTYPPLGDINVEQVMAFPGHEIFEIAGVQRVRHVFQAVAAGADVYRIFGEKGVGCGTTGGGGSLRQQ